MDYYEKFVALSEDKLSDEIRGLTKRLLAISPQSGMYDQLLNMLHTAESIYEEKIMVAKFRGSESNSVINIGSIDESVYTPDYSREELLDAVVTLYLGK
jgi:hypothetical protein